METISSARGDVKLPEYLTLKNRNFQNSRRSSFQNEKKSTRLIFTEARMKKKKTKGGGKIKQRKSNFRDEKVKCKTTNRSFAWPKLKFPSCKLQIYLRRIAATIHATNVTRHCNKTQGRHYNKPFEEEFLVASFILTTDKKASCQIQQQLYLYYNCLDYYSRRRGDRVSLFER